MLRHMRTTIRLPDDLYREVKVTAASTGRNVTSFIEEALRAALLREHEPADLEREAYRVTPVGVGGVVPGVDLTDSARLLELMERE